MGQQIVFTKATKKGSKLRLALTGPAKSGKTYSALRIGSALADAGGGRVAVVDTEHKSASKYADLFDFDALELTNFKPIHYVQAIKAAEGAGYDVLILDSLSHAWAGTGGILRQLDKLKGQGNDFTKWGDLTPQHDALIEAILASDIHIIVTMRAKMAYVLEEVERKGKTVQVPRKVGLAPIQRDGMEYEFDVLGDMHRATLTVTDTRCPALRDEVIHEPGEDVAAILLDWLGEGGSETEAREAADKFIERIAKTKKLESLKALGDEIGSARLPKHHADRVRDAFKARWQVLKAEERAAEEEAKREAEEAMTQPPPEPETTSEADDEPPSDVDLPNMNNDAAE